MKVVIVNPMLRAALLLFLITVLLPSVPEAAANCTSASCSDDEAPCPPDSEPDNTREDSPCVCVPEHCVQPTCHGSHLVLQRKGSGSPGDCCDIYDCVSPRGKNCSNVVCPEEPLNCPPDSYHLPSHRAPNDCCSVPQGCQCLPLQSCPKPTCSLQQQARVVRPGGTPGSCCPVYECVDYDANSTCVLDGNTVENGTVWNKDPCTRCNCKNGSIFCDIIVCPSLATKCSLQRVPPGECCSVCMDDSTVKDTLPQPGGCVSGSRVLQNGEEWKEDPCTTCSCHSGKVHCVSSMCKLTCLNPVYGSDECCPQCDSTSVVVLPRYCPSINCSLRCIHGFVKDEAGCLKCQCQADGCALKCPYGFQVDKHNNRLCECAPETVSECPSLGECHKDCPHGFRQNKAGCKVCKCKQCSSLLDCNKKCVYGLRTNDKGCPICRCQDSRDHKLMTMQNINEKTCLSADNGIHEDGETWNDGCRQCYCHRGKEMCNLITCPVPVCKNPVFNTTTDCCPWCPAVGKVAQGEHHTMVCHSFDGSYRVEGETWPLDVCTTCLCHSGRVLCETKQCPAAPCPEPIHDVGECCPTCPANDVDPHGKACSPTQPNGAKWREGPCRSCICDRGETKCFTDTCAKITCERPVLVKNRCCPVCVDLASPKVCLVGNMTYLPGEQWNEDVCTHCSCNDGVKSCTEKICNTACSNSIKKSGKCCPICADDNTTKNQVELSNPTQSLDIFVESTYIILITVLFFMCVCLASYIGLQCHRRKQQHKLDGTPKSCNNPAYNDYMHRDSMPPPHYTSTEKKPKCDPYHYKYVPPYDTQHEMLKSSSIGSTEKSALAPV